MRRRERTLAAVDVIWQGELRPRLQNFLNHSEQPNGDLILSLALEGEGRTVTDTRALGQVAVGFPDSPDHAMDALYAFAHEVVGPLTGPAVEDNTTPAEKRSGVATVIGSYALVRGSSRASRPNLPRATHDSTCASPASRSTATRWPRSHGPSRFRSRCWSRSIGRSPFHSGGFDQ